jgi:signal peptidase I
VIPPDLDENASVPEQPEPTEPVEDHKKHLPLWLEFPLLIGAALLIAVLIKTFLFQAFWIPSSSMEDTLQIYDRVLVSKVSYEFSDISRLDVIVFDDPRSGFEQPLVEPYLKQPELPIRDFGPVEVPEGSLFVMGDNRRASQDSRFFGPIPIEDVVGKAFVIIWPISRFGGI